jgi:hypothetical protein
VVLEVKDKILRLKTLKAEGRETAWIDEHGASIILNLRSGMLLGMLESTKRIANGDN